MKTMKYKWFYHDISYQTSGVSYLFCHSSFGNRNAIKRFPTSGEGKENENQLHDTRDRKDKDGKRIINETTGDKKGKPINKE